MHHCLTHHRQFRLLFTIVNKAYYYISPYTGMSGAILIILTNYESIRFYGIIPMPIYLGIPLCSLATFIIMCLIFPVASGVYEFSLGFLAKRKLILTEDKYFLWIIYSEKPISYDCGQFFILKRSTEKIKSTHALNCSLFSPLYITRIVSVTLLFSGGGNI